jgi:hypothetical protein
MYMTQQDVNNLLQFAALSAAQKIGVADGDWGSAENLAAAVRFKDPVLGVALDSFAKAYISWFSFGERIFAEGKGGNMSSAETAEHFNLVAERDSARNSFIDALKCAV